MSSPTWEEQVEEFINDRIREYRVNPKAAWQIVAEFAKENAEALTDYDDGSGVGNVELMLPAEWGNLKRQQSVDQRKPKN